jgi:hypothetical protein
MSGLRVLCYIVVAATMLCAGGQRRLAGEGMMFVRVSLPLPFFMMHYPFITSSQSRACAIFSNACILDLLCVCLSVCFYVHPSLSSNSSSFIVRFSVGLGMKWRTHTHYIADTDLRTAIVNLLRREGVWLSMSGIQNHLKKNASIEQITRLLDASDKHLYFKEHIGAEDPKTGWIDFTEKGYQALPKPI